jgi:Flp pilus assembly protein TadB
VSKERAQRRAAREAETARRVAEAEARNEKQIAARRRKDRRAAAVRTVLPRGRRRWSRRTREQRAIAAVVLIAVALATYVLVEDWGVRIAILLVALLVTLVADRSTR